MSLLNFGVKGLNALWVEALPLSVLGCFKHLETLSWQILVTHEGNGCS